MTLVDWSYAIMESGLQFGRGRLVTKRQLLPANSLASLNILVSEQVKVFHGINFL